MPADYCEMIADGPLADQFVFVYVAWYPCGHWQAEQQLGTGFGGGGGSGSNEGGRSGWGGAMGARGGWEQPPPGARAGGWDSGGHRDTDGVRGPGPGGGADDREQRAGGGQFHAVAAGVQRGGGEGDTQSPSLANSRFESSSPTADRHTPGQDMRMDMSEDDWKARGTSKLAAASSHLESPKVSSQHHHLQAHAGSHQASVGQPSYTSPAGGSLQQQHHPQHQAAQHLTLMQQQHYQHSSQSAGSSSAGVGVPQQQPPQSHPPGWSPGGQLVGGVGSPIHAALMVPGTQQSPGVVGQRPQPSGVWTPQHQQQIQIQQQQIAWQQKQQQQGARGMAAVGPIGGAILGHPGQLAGRALAPAAMTAHHHPPQPQHPRVAGLSVSTGMSGSGANSPRGIAPQVCVFRPGCVCISVLFASQNHYTHPTPSRNTHNIAETMCLSATIDGSKGFAVM